MREINRIILHCTATPEGREVSVSEVDRWHRERGWSGIGYHYLVGLDGIADGGRPVSRTGAHTRGHNADSIGICYVGGLDADRQPKDTRTPAQILTMDQLIDDLRREHGQHITVHGHNEFAAKACPSFNVQQDRWDRRR